MRDLKILSVLMSIALAPFASAQAPVKSGLQPGESAGAFNVLDATGPRKGERPCYACAFGKHSVVNVQTREMTDELVEIIKKLDALVDSPRKIRGNSKHAFVVYITDDPDAAKELVSIAEKHSLKNVPLTIFDELTGPSNYKIARDAAITVMMWKDTKVSSNLSFDSARIDAASVKDIYREAEKHLQ